MIESLKLHLFGLRFLIRNERLGIIKINEVHQGLNSDDHFRLELQILYRIVSKS